MEECLQDRVAAPAGRAAEQQPGANQVLVDRRASHAPYGVEFLTFNFIQVSTKTPSMSARQTLWRSLKHLNTTTPLPPLPPTPATTMSYPNHTVLEGVFGTVGFQSHVPTTPNPLTKGHSDQQTPRHHLRPSNPRRPNPLQPLRPIPPLARPRARQKNRRVAQPAQKAAELEGAPTPASQNRARRDA